MITTRTTALIAAMSLLGTVIPAAAFAQNTSVNSDDDFNLQTNAITQVQAAFNDASAGNVKGDDNVAAGNNGFALSFQNQDADASNDVDDNDDFNTTQVDICDTVVLAFTC
jgi:hypothetical protein